jgi:hypothetical protein
MGYPEDRTHGADSAIDDTMIPAPNMTDAADASQAIPGAEAIPANMPDAPHGDISLEYNLQNFNALVAANTAMETALADAAIREAALQDENAHLREVINESLKPAVDALKKATDDQERIIRAQEKKLGEAAGDLQFAHDQRDALQRRLDRSLGYLDRVLDDEDGIHAPQTRTVPAPRPAVGPALGEIPDAVRPDTARRASMGIDWSPGEIRGFDEPGTARRRRY